MKKKKVPIKAFWYSDTMVIPMSVTIITTVNKDGVVNAAPYSLVLPYNISKKNPQIIVCISRHTHTCKNIMETKEFVINYPTASHLEEVMELCRLYPEGINELEYTTLTPIDSLKVRPPSIMECPQHIECVLSHNLEEDSVHAKLIGDVAALVMNEDIVNIDRGKRIEQLNFPLYMGDEKKRYFYYGDVSKTTMFEVGPIPSRKGGTKVITRIPWEEGVLAKLEEIPPEIRQIVVETVENVVKKEGEDRVTHELFLQMLEDYAPPEVLEKFKNNM